MERKKSETAKQGGAKKTSEDILFFFFFNVKRIMVIICLTFLHGSGTELCSDNSHIKFSNILLCFYLYPLSFQFGKGNHSLARLEKSR